MEAPNLDRPIQLVKLNSEGIFEICPEGLELLSSIDSKVGVVSIAGPARSGKSFIMNLLCTGKGNGFAVGDSVITCTKGIWLRSRPLPVGDMQVLIMDSEGSRSKERSETYDGKLMALLILISSVFILNSKGVINEGTVSDLNVATYFAEILNSEGQKWHTKFVWLLRDFCLELVDDSGNAISTKEYLDTVFNTDYRNPRTKEKFEKVKEIMFNLFEEIDCIALPFPVLEEKKVRNMEGIESLRDKFVEDFYAFKQKVIEQCPAKRIDGSEVTGAILSELIATFVSALNSDAIPSVKNAWHEVLQNQYEKACAKAKRNFTDKTKSLELPYEHSTLLEKLETFKQESLAFEEIKVKDTNLEDRYMGDFKYFYTKEVEKWTDFNNEESLAKNTQLAIDVFGETIRKLDNKEYEADENWKEAWKVAVESYTSSACGSNILEALTEFARKNQSSEFAMIFWDCVIAYENDLKHLKKEIEKIQNDIDELGNEVMEDENVKEWIQFNMQELKEEMKDTSREIFERIDYAIRIKLKSFDEFKIQLDSPRASCNCLAVWR